MWQRSTFVHAELPRAVTTGNPYRAGKLSACEEDIRVPLIVSSSGVPCRAQCGQLCSDLAGRVCLEWAGRCP